MPKDSDAKIALVALIAFAVWLFVGLPLLYLPSQDHVHGEILGVKYGEWLLFLATMALFWATWRLVTGAEKTAERQLRAYVFLDSINLRRFDVPENQWKIQIAWKNTGRTRTRRLIAKVSHHVLELSKQPLETFDFHDEPDAQTFHGLIGPSQSVNPPPITIADIHLFGGCGDDTALLIWGWAEYQDVFNDIIHRTEFGFRVWIEGDILGKCLIRFESTEKHNAADEDCMKTPPSAP
jgi:hypothetical protein